jgi:hypothetical protein
VIGANAGAGQSWCKRALPVFRFGVILLCLVKAGYLSMKLPMMLISSRQRLAGTRHGDVTK